MQVGNNNDRLVHGQTANCLEVGVHSDSHSGDHRKVCLKYIRGAIQEGMTKDVSDIAAMTGMDRKTIIGRIKTGWSAERVVETLAHKGNNSNRGIFRMREAS